MADTLLQRGAKPSEVLPLYGAGFGIQNYRESGGSLGAPMPGPQSDSGGGDYLSRSKTAESGGDPNARSPTSTSSGLYGFTAGR
jgi:hypothetical protein